MDSSASKSSGEPVKQAVALENAKGPETPSTEYEEYLDLNREFTGKRLQKLVRKFDWHVLPQLIIIYLLAYIDRNNVGNARLFGSEADMKLSGQDWNTGLSVFFVTYAAGGVPSNIALKRFGPMIWLPFLLFCVSLIIIGSSMQINVHGWLAFRVLLGWFEAGVFPGCSFILTTWYNSAEIHTRMLDEGTLNERSRGSPKPLASSYEYFHLAYDSSHPQISLALPPYPYSCYLVDQVEVFMARDYHWFRWNEFRKRMDLTYKSPELPQSRDRLYLCRMLIVFALGETYVNCHAPTINLAATVGGVDDDILVMKDQLQQVEPPGGRFFDQALVLMKLPYEEPSVDDIEILNLATFYSYSLNRKKTAYMYAGASARTCNLLRLHQPPTASSLPASELEHRRRVCWTSFCLDKMTSSELGILPSFQPLQIKIGYPSDESLGPEDDGNFFEAEFLRARIQITMMKSEIDVFIDQWQSIKDDIPDIEKRARPILAKLESWTQELPAFMCFDCEEGMPEAMTQRASMRSLSSHYLRCNQCFILLLRPFFLKQVICIVSDEAGNGFRESLEPLSTRCLRAARTNVNIIIGLWRREKLAKFGFWDSMHLFSSLMLVCLAMAVNKRRPGSFDEKENDFVTYSTGKTVLSEMVQAGNLASKGHERMLLEIEQLAEVLGGIQAGGIELLMEQWDVDAWMTQALGHDASMSALFFHDVEE